MTKIRSNSVLSKGFFQVRTDYSNISVDYREHDTRNGRLLVILEDNPVDAMILREVADRLEEEEKKLREGRARYADMAATHTSLAGCLEDEEEDDVGDADDDEDDEYEDEGELILEHGTTVAYQDWDSGGPGAGAGRVSLIKYKGRYYISHDAGLDDLGTDGKAALLNCSVIRRTDATEEIWVSDEFGGIEY